MAVRSAGPCADGTSPASSTRGRRSSRARTCTSRSPRPTGRRPGSSGGVVRRAMDGIMLVDCVSAPFRGRRDSATIGARGPIAKENVVGFQFVRKGVETVREGRREITLSPGSIAIWDGLEPTDIEIVEPFRKRTLLFPRDRVQAVCPRLGELGPLPSLENSGPARLLARYMNALAAELPLLGTAAAVSAANVALELLRAAIEPELPSGRTAERAAVRAEIRRHVRRHLQDADLGPTTIARAFAMSVRSAARPVRRGRRVGRGDRPQRAAAALPRGPPASRRAARSPRSPSAGGSVRPPISPGSSSAGSASPRARSGTWRSSAPRSGWAPAARRSRTSDGGRPVGSPCPRCGAESPA